MSDMPGRGLGHGVTWTAAGFMLAFGLASLIASLAWPDLSDMFLGFAAAAAAVAMLGGTLHTIRTGRAQWRYDVIRRADRPAAFWATVAASLLGVCISTVLPGGCFRPSERPAPGAMVKT